MTHLDARGQSSAAECALNRKYSKTVPLATAVIGGLTTSTMLTLFIVPTVYTFFDDLARKFRKVDKDLAAPSELVPLSVSAFERLPDAGSLPSESPKPAPSVKEKK